MTMTGEVPGGIERRLATLEEQLAQVRQFVADMALGASISDVPMYLFEGGRMPEPKTDGAVGYDCYARAIVDPTSQPSGDNPLRRTRADFLRTPGWRSRVDSNMHNWIIDDPENRDQYGIALPPGERCMVGLGFATAMPLPLFYYVLPRSGHASRGVNLDNSPGTVDPDYRGEAGALITNRSPNPFKIYKHTRVVQIVFTLAIMPRLAQVADIGELPPSLRGVGGFGSTGAHG